MKEASTDNSPVFPLVGSGAFQMDQWDKTAHTWSLSANKDYWGGAPQIDNYVIKKYDNVEAMVNALKTGEIDYASTHLAGPVQLPQGRRRHHHERRDPVGIRQPDLQHAR